MRIALVHSFYRSSQPSGENAVVETQVSGLRALGHEVVLIAKYSDHELKGVSSRVKTSVNVATGTGPSPIEELAAFSPDIVHVHNLFPNFGLRWSRRWSGPLIVTLHNFRYLCSNGLLYRDGAKCSLCPDGDRLGAIKHGCFHDSRIASIPLAVANFSGPGNNPLIERADAIIALSVDAKELYVKYGVPRHKIRVIPNGVQGHRIEPTTLSAQSRWLFAGRLSAEKGITTLCRWLPAERRLDIAGSGPQEGDSALEMSKNVTLLGHLSKVDLADRMRMSLGLIVPSECLDSQPTVAIEALSQGLPLVAREGNSVATLIDTYGVGATYSDPHTLGLALDFVERQGAALRETALEVFRREFQSSTWLERLETLYGDVITAGQQRP